MINKILKIMKKNNEIITPAQLEEKGISRVYLSRMEEEGIIERIDRGIYATKDFKYDEYYLFQLKYPKAIAYNPIYGDKVFGTLSKSNKKSKYTIPLVNTS